MVDLHLWLSRFWQVFNPFQLYWVILHYTFTPPPFDTADIGKLMWIFTQHALKSWHTTAANQRTAHCHRRKTKRLVTIPISRIRQLETRGLRFNSLQIIPFNICSHIGHIFQLPLELFRLYCSSYLVIKGIWWYTQQCSFCGSHYSTLCTLQLTYSWQMKHDRWQMKQKKLNND